MSDKQLHLDFDIKLTTQHHYYKIANLPLSSEALALLNLQEQAGKKILFIANNSAQSNRIHNELAIFNTSNIATNLIPSNGTLAYERQSINPEITSKRIKSISDVLAGHNTISIVPAEALVSRLAPRAFYKNYSLNIAVKQILDLARLSEELVSFGYLRVNHINEAGEFVIRGGVVDIAPINHKYAYRIELFDNEVEQIGILDIATNKISEKIPAIKLSTTKEYPHDKDSINKFIHNFRKYFSNHGNKALTKDISDGLLLNGLENFINLFFDETSCLIDFFDDDYLVVYESNLQSELSRIYREYAQRYEYYKIEYPCIAPKDLYYTEAEIFGKLKKHQVVILDNEIPNKLSLHQLQINTTTPNLIKRLDEVQQQHKNIVVFCPSIGRLTVISDILTKHNTTHTSITRIDQLTHNNINLIIGDLEHSFTIHNLAIISDNDLSYIKTIGGKKRSRRISTTVTPDYSLNDLAELEIDDLVVHEKFGIGRYCGIEVQNIAGIDYELITLEYQNNSRLFIPITSLNLLSKYTRINGGEVILNKLGSKSWDKIKLKTQEKLEDIAVQLLELYAIREKTQGITYELPNNYAEFASSFGYQETIDQQNSIDDIIKDMTTSKPMDRLIVGDVGFGKTEVAMRAAFIAASNGYQVAILAPTTLLVEQHYHNFVNRMHNFGIKIAHLSRFKSIKDNKLVLHEMALGRLDIIIGTHRLIQKDVEFNSLGLVIIDEEHRFGVTQKEKLKTMRSNIDFLSMAATPIPRSLSMALEGIRDMSIIATPPLKRLAIKTIVSEYDKSIITEAINREIRRGGQVFFLHNDVASINQAADDIANLHPDIRIAIAHGQMSENDLEQTIKSFIFQRYNVLVCSTIIETGIDIPNANTIIINRADKLGLAQLHQLRGRVGRSFHQAYAYLLGPEKTTKDATKRLEAIEATSSLGSGLNLAMYDLEIRGAGEVLGDLQSGNIKEVGLSLYTNMLKKTIKKLSSLAKNKDDFDFETQINVKLSTIIPEKYCSNTAERLIYYKQLASAKSSSEIDDIYQDMINKHGLPLPAINNLIDLHQNRVLANSMGITQVNVANKLISLIFCDKPNINPQQLIKIMQELKTCRYDGKNKLIWESSDLNIDNQLGQINYLLTKLDNQL